MKRLNSTVSLSDLKDPLETSKDKFVKLIKKRKMKLVINSNVLDLRCDTYRKYFDGVNIFIIFIGSLLTILEAFCIIICYILLYFISFITIFINF